MKTTPTAPSPRAPRTALVIAHPGHELRLHGWVERNQPVTYVLTDGSGRSSPPRIDATTSVLTAAGARRGTIYGRLADRVVYQRTLAGDRALFIGLAHELADQLVDQQIEVVLGDAEDNSFMTHDLWRGVRRAAVRLAERKIGPIVQLETYADGHPHERPSHHDGPVTWLELSDQEFARKNDAASNYGPIAALINALIDRVGREPFRRECYFAAQDAPPLPPPNTKPRYEIEGESHVAKGIYPEVLRYREHVAPILTALASEAEDGS